jgi:capsular exopolysaccharide synthesis family protein
MEFWQYYRVVRRRRWVFLVVALVTLGTVLYAYQPLPAGYAATASIKADSTAPLVSVLNSRTVLAATAEQLHVSPRALEGRFVVREDREAGVVRVMALGTTPEGAERAATAFVQAGIQVYDRLIREGTSRQRAFIQAQLAQAQTRLQEAQARLASFRARSGASVSPTVAAALDRTMALESARDAAIAERADVQARLAATDSLLSQEQRTRTERVIQENPAAQKIQSELIGLQIALNEELAVHTEQHPNVIALRTRIALLERMLATELHKVLTSETIGANPLYEKLLGNRIDLLVQLASANARIEGASAALRDMRGRLPVLSRNEAELARLTQEAASAERIVTALQDRFLDAQLKEQEVLSTAGPHLLDPATASGAAIPSERTSRLLIGLLLGAALGLAAAFFTDYVDATIRTTKDAERVLGIPAAGTIPAHNPPVADAYAALRNNLVNETPGVRTLLVTGVRPGSGTSTVARNLAAAYARAGMRTVLVDANFRHPSVPPAAGLGTFSQVLGGEADVAGSLQEGDVPGLWVLPAGPAPDDPSGRLHARLPGILDALKERCDIIVLDAPAAAPFPEALAIAPHVDGTVLVVAAGQAIGADGVRVRDQLVRARARLLGIVVNRVSSPDDETYALYARYMGRSPLAAQVAGGALVLLLVLSVGMAAGWYLDAPWWHWARTLLTSHVSTVVRI